MLVVEARDRRRWISFPFENVIPAAVRSGSRFGSRCHFPVCNFQAPLFGFRLSLSFSRSTRFSSVDEPARFKPEVGSSSRSGLKHKP
jgi:hypothetical protein